MLARWNLQDASGTLARSTPSSLILAEPFDSFGSPDSYGAIPSGWSRYQTAIDDPAKQYTEETPDGIAFHFENTTGSLQRFGLSNASIPITNGKGHVVILEWRRIGAGTGTFPLGILGGFQVIANINAGTLNEWQTTTITAFNSGSTFNLTPHTYSSTLGHNAHFEIRRLVVYEEIAGTYARGADLTTVAGPGGLHQLAYGPNGTSDFVDVLGGNPPLPATGTIAVWLKDLASGNKAIVAKGVNDQVMLFNESTSLKLRVGGTGSDLLWSHSGTSGWHHYAATWNATVGKLYKDGVQVATGTVNATPSNNTKKWRIGQFDATTGGYYLNHPAAAAYLDNTDIDATAIAALYAEGAPQILTSPTISGSPILGTTANLALGTWSDGEYAGGSIFVADDTEGTNEDEVGSIDDLTITLDEGEWGTLLERYIRIRTYQFNSRGQYSSAVSNWLGPIVPPGSGRRKRNVISFGIITP